MSYFGARKNNTAPTDESWWRRNGDDFVKDDETVK